jgi:hypothetical protein
LLVSFQIFKKKRKTKWTKFNLNLTSNSKKFWYFFEIFFIFKKEFNKIVCCSNRRKKSSNNFFIPSIVHKIHGNSTKIRFRRDST